MQPGPRVYTFFLYLSDVEEGGGTRLDALLTSDSMNTHIMILPVPVGC